MREEIVRLRDEAAATVPRDEFQAVQARPLHSFPASYSLPPHLTALGARRWAPPPPPPLRYKSDAHLSPPYKPDAHLSYPVQIGRTSRPEALGARR